MKDENENTNKSDVRETRTPGLVGEPVTIKIKVAGKNEYKEIQTYKYDIVPTLARIVKAGIITREEAKRMVRDTIDEFFVQDGKIYYERKPLMVKGVVRDQLICVEVE
ncbi:MAG: hypothetical protein J7L14_02930 [Candidatus Diapherotrites archaeon]|nr:hypothetical protein [Candidatus Diapherotrites archaeon]